MSAELGEQQLLKGGYGGGGGAVGQQEQENIPCPRCESTNTKFCYYNNYNLSQPRYFCKSCRRYWTRGGTLRNIPVGGGSRKSSKRRFSRPSSSTFSSCATSQPPPPLANANGVSSDDHADAVKTTSLQGPPVVDTPDVNLNEALPVGSFSLLLGSVQQNNPFLGLGGYGLGLGFDGLAFGQTTNGPVVGGSSDQEPPSECNTWQVGEAEGGMTDSGDCFGWPDLAI